MPGTIAIATRGMRKTCERGGGRGGRGGTQWQVRQVLDQCACLKLLCYSLVTHASLVTSQPGTTYLGIALPLARNTFRPPHPTRAIHAATLLTHTARRVPWVCGAPCLVSVLLRALAHAAWSATAGQGTTAASGARGLAQPQSMRRACGVNDNSAPAATTTAGARHGGCGAGRRRGPSERGAFRLGISGGVRF